MAEPSILEQALAEIDKGQFGRALELARQAARTSPNNAEALRAQGIAEFRLGNTKEAIMLLRRSLRLDPLEPAAHVALGNALHEAGQLDAAINSYRKALRFDPESVPAHNDLGTALYARGRIEEAITAFEEALRRNPDQPMIHENLGSALRRAGRFAAARRAFVRSLKLRLATRIRSLVGMKPVRPPSSAVREGELAGKSAITRAVRLHGEAKREEALALCDQILGANHDHAEALHLKGLILVDRDRANDALPLLERAAELGPNIPEFHNTLGYCHRKLDNPGQAIAAYRRSLELNPQFSLAHINFAELLADMEDHAGAERAARAAIASDPEHIPGRLILARALMGRGRFTEAETAVREILAKESYRVDGWLYLGQALREQERMDEAWSAFSTALGLAPENHLVHLTLGAYFLECRRDPGKALEHYREAKRLEPQSPSAALNEAIACFATGDYSRQAWELYESRRRQRPRVVAYRKIPLPEWDGVAAPGRGLLIYGEQGIGDEIMFASMVPEAAKRVGNCTFACDPRLRELFARSFPGVRCFAWPRENLEPGSPELSGADMTIPLASLGRHFRAGRERFPPAPGYLCADPQRTEAWRSRLRELGEGPYFGLAWQGGIWTTGRARRTVGLAALARALESSRARWVSLQLGAEQPKIDAEAGGLRVVHWSEALASVEDSAALIAALDGVVSVCSWIVHLSGALGKPVTVLAPFAPEWRYGLAGTGMIWYPSATVLRQARYGEWDTVLIDLRAQFVPGEG